MNSRKKKVEGYPEGFPEEWKGNQKINGLKPFYVPDNPKEFFIQHTYGPNGERKMLVPPEDLYGIPVIHRDYCAHLYIPYFDCLQKTGYLVQHACHHEWADYERCKHEERRRNKKRDKEWKKLAIELEVEREVLREKDLKKGG